MRSANTTEVSAVPRWCRAHGVAVVLADGNLHLIVQVPPERYPVVEAMVCAPLADAGGSVSAEHGIGLEKKRWLHASRNPTELALVRCLKKLLDPKNILDPGKIVDLDPVRE